MTKDELLNSASQLRTPSTAAASAYEQAREAMVLEVNQRMHRIEGITAMVGQGNMILMQDNHRNHAEFMSGLFSMFDTAVLVETVIWVFRTYMSRGFQVSYWEHQLDVWVEVILETLDDDSAREVLPTYHWLLEHIGDFEKARDAT